jgi:hypothetical protein
MHQPTPYDGYFTLAGRLFDQAMHLGEGARAAVKNNDLAGAVGRYEAAIARLVDSRDLTEVNVRTAAAVAQEEAQRREYEGKSHPWPIAELEREGVSQRPTPYPRWAVNTTDGGNGDARVSLGQSVHQDDPTPMLLTVDTDSVDGGAHSATAQVTLLQLRALLALAERIDAGLPVPYDYDGNAQVS